MTLSWPNDSATWAAALLRFFIASFGEGVRLHSSRTSGITKTASPSSVYFLAAVLMAFVRPLMKANSSIFCERFGMME